MATLLDRVVVLNREGAATKINAPSISHFRPYSVHECGELAGPGP